MTAVTTPLEGARFYLLYSPFRYLLKFIISHLNLLFSRLNQSQVTQFLFKYRNVQIPSSYLCSWHGLLSNKSQSLYWTAQSWTQFPQCVLSILNRRKDHLSWPSENFLTNANQKAALPGLQCAPALYRSLQIVYILSCCKNNCTKGLLICPPWNLKIYLGLKKVIN